MRDSTLVDAAAPADNGARTARAAESPAVERRWETLAQLIANPTFMQPPMAIAPPFVHAGAHSLVAALSKKGKSTLSSKLAAAVSVGGELVMNDGIVFPRGKVLYVCLDEPTTDLVRRLVMFGADPENVVILRRHLVRGVADIRDTIEGAGPFALTIIDTLDKLAVKEGIVDSGNPMPWSDLLGRLSDLVHDTPGGMLTNHHLARAGNVRDSTAIEAGVDAVFRMTPRPGDDRARDFTAEARWEISPFTLRYQDGRFYHSDATVEREADTASARAVKLVEVEAGHYSVDTLTAALGGTTSTTRGKVRSLVASGLLTVVKKGRTRKLYPTPAQHPSMSVDTRRDGYPTDVGNECHA